MVPPFIKRLLKQREVTKANHWKIAEDVKRVTISGKKFKELGSDDSVPHELGRGQFGTVVIGRVKFKDGTERRVAVKRFHNDNQLSDEKAAEYQRVIDEFRTAGINIPKMGLYKMPNGEWVQISPLYGSTAKGSKFFENDFNFELRYFDRYGEKTALEVFEQSVKIANLGYKPVGDIFVITKKGHHPIPLDIDLLIVAGKKEFKVISKAVGNLYSVMKSVGADERKLKEIILRVGKKEFIAYFSKYWAKQGI